MFLLDNKITIESRPILEEFLDGFDYNTSGISFSSLYMWRDINNFCWQKIGDYICISGLSHLVVDKQEPFLFPLLSNNGRYDSSSLRKTIYAAKKIFEGKGYEFGIRLMPKHMIEIIEEACPGEMDRRKFYRNFQKINKLGKFRIIGISQYSVKTLTFIYKAKKNRV